MIVQWILKVSRNILKLPADSLKKNLPIMNTVCQFHLYYYTTGLALAYIDH